MSLKEQIKKLVDMLDEKDEKLLRKLLRIVNMAVCTGKIE